MSEVSPAPSATSPLPSGAPGDVLFALRGLAVGHGRQVVLSDVSWSVRRGEIWFLLGANGSGKSTLLHAILGLLRPLRGDISLAPSLRSRAGIGFVPQRCDLKPTLPMRVRDFVRLGLVGQRLSRAEARARVSRAAAELCIAGKLPLSYWTLSGGERQRALVARALARDPELFILDEPTSGLDLPVEDALLGALAARNRTVRAGIVVVTHQVRLAERFATHVAFVEGGCLTTGTREETLASPAFLGARAAPPLPPSRPPAAEADHGGGAA
jgi:ABC-type Mn2+/Zn2+ transport system ATPase subunit